MLIAGGDSWSCWPQEEFYGSRDRCWPALVSKALNVPLIDHSMCGCSNSRIFRKCLPAILENPGSTVVIFWSHSVRFELGLNGLIEQFKLPHPKKKHEYKMLGRSYFKNHIESHLQYINTMLCSLAIQSACKATNSVLLQKFVFESDTWWDGTLDSFKQFLREDEYFELDDNQIKKKFEYLQKVHGAIDPNTWIDMQVSLQDIIEVSAEFKDHPTDAGHEAMAQLVLDRLGVLQT